MTILVTGVAGFIGSHFVEALLARDETVIGIDNLNNYYDVKLKQDRLKKLQAHKNFIFHRVDIADQPAMNGVLQRHPQIDRIVHLAAQAGVRHSLKDPFAYVHANVEGHLVMLELARKIGDGLKNFVYASSSSVYGANQKQPFATSDRTDHPVALYGATKKAGEVMTESYVRLFGFPASGLRFFTVYGPWGRPDMAAFLFTKAILEDKPITLFNQGEMQRDFTYIDDIVAGILGALDRPRPRGQHKLYNLGNHQPVALKTFVKTIEDALGKKATWRLEPLQQGDVVATFADIADSQADLDFHPQTSIEKGIAEFVSWYRDYYGL